MRAPPMRPPALRCKAGPRPPPGSPPVHLRKKVKLEPTPPPGPPPAHLIAVATEDPYLLAEPGFTEAKEVEEHDYQQEGQYQQGYQQGYHRQGYQQGQRQQGQDQQGYQQDGDQQGLDQKAQHQKALAEAKEEEQAAEPGLAKKEPDLTGFVKAKAKELALLLARSQQGYHQKCQDQQGYQQGQRQKGQCQQQGYQQDGDQEGLDQKAQHQKGQQRGLLAEAKEAAKPVPEGPVPAGPRAEKEDPYQSLEVLMREEKEAEAQWSDHRENSQARLARRSDAPTAREATSSEDAHDAPARGGDSISPPWGGIGPRTADPLWLLALVVTGGGGADSLSP